jgi:hypothetical protein
MKRFVERMDRGQSTLFPECLEDWICVDNPVRVIDVFVGGLDLAELRFCGVDPEATGRPSYHPSVPFLRPMCRTSSPGSSGWSVMMRCSSLRISRAACRSATSRSGTSRCLSAPLPNCSGLGRVRMGIAWKSPPSRKASREPYVFRNAQLKLWSKLAQIAAYHYAR